MRMARIKADGAGYYHCMSRIIEKRHVLGNLEKERFRKTMRDLEGFCCLQILTYAVMGNHFHILVRVPPRRELSDSELIYRLGLLYTDKDVEQVAKQLAGYRKAGMEGAAEALKRRYTYRMFDISEFFKTLKQKFSQYYNRREGRCGPLWEQRFKSILIEGSENALSTISAYIDLNAVRAGFVGDPKDYRFCGYAEAMAGSKDARMGLNRVLGIEDRRAIWSDYGRRYRRHLYIQGAQKGQRADGLPIRPGFSRDQVQAVLQSGGRLPLAEALRCRVRYFSDGLVLGSQAFAEEVFVRYRQQFGPKRQTGARPMKYADWKGLCTLRNLRLSPVLPV